MNRLILACFFVLMSICDVRAANSTQDLSTIFPPVRLNGSECTGNDLKVISWSKGYASTICLTGQEVLKLAIPTCTAGNNVVFDGQSFICMASSNIPTCTSRQRLTYNGVSFTCVDNDPVPTCTGNQVLTFNGSSYVCVDYSPEIPTCGQGYFLTYNGTSFQCAAQSALNVPTCTTNQFLTGIGGRLVCADISGTSSHASCAWRDTLGNVSNYTNEGLTPNPAPHGTSLISYSSPANHLDSASPTYIWTCIDGSWTRTGVAPANDTNPGSN